MDLNGDGNIDLLAAGYAGIIYVFYGKEDGTLSSPVILKDKTGTDIHSGKYYSFMKGNYITEKDIDNPDKIDFARAFDIDNDGDLDLLLSGNKGTKLRENIGSKDNPVFIDKNVDITPKHHVYDFVDWDGDGFKDLVCGDKVGGVYYYNNTGTKRNPVFKKSICILDKTAFINKENGGDVRICQVAVADYNNDGKLDIIVGNPNTVNRPKLNLSDAQIKERDSLQNKYEEYRAKYDKIMGDILKVPGKDRKKLVTSIQTDKEYIKIRNEMGEAKGKLRQFEAGMDKHGYIFVSLRK